MCDAYDIGDTLTALAASGAVLTVYPAGALRARQARIASVDPEQPHFVLELLAPPGQMAPSLAAGRATFVAALENDAMLQFELDTDWRALPGQPRQVAAPFPATCLVQERRASPRNAVSLAGNYRLHFTLQGQDIDVPLCDYSTAGIGLHAPSDLASLFSVGMKLRAVRLQLGPALAIDADLEVRLLRPFHSYLLGQQVQIGCSIDQIGMQLRGM